MIGRFVKDESGMTMALTIFMIVIIGVMGAGLLTFVQNDLKGVVEVNQGQRALEMANAGVQAAKRHLATVDAKPRDYDVSTANGDSEWSEITGVGVGEKRIDFDGDGQNDIFVKIRYLTPSATESEATLPDKAPEVLPPGATDGPDEGADPDYPSNRNYFRVTVRGQAGNAVRQVQAIYKSQNFDIPVAFYATRDIDFNGNATTVEGISLFAQRCITDLRPDNIAGPDQAYGDWYNDPITGTHNASKNPNNVPRPTNRAGAAARGIGTGDAVPSGCGSASGIVYDPASTNTKQKAGTAAIQRYGLRDVDRDSNIASVTGSKKFSIDTWSPASQPSNTITFPFKTGDADADNTLLNELKIRALDQGHYIRKTSGSSFYIDDGTGAENYPRDSTLDTVMFIEFADGAVDTPVYGNKGTATYRARTPSGDNLVKGTIVVVNGDLNTSSSADDFQGAFIVRDGVNPGSATTESRITKYDNGGSINLQGFMNVEGDISLRGNVDGLLPGDLVNGISGLYSLSLWSWRECYNTSCS